MSEGAPLNVEFDVIDKSERNLQELKSRLPSDSVAALAREVISLVARVAPPVDVSDPSNRVISDLSKALISKDQFAGADFIRRVQREGASAETVYLKYLATAARMLGDWWSEDRVTFAEVTIGASRIYAIMRGLRRHFERFGAEAQDSVVFASVPGETHTLGVTMAADFFRSDGWDVTLHVGLEHDALVTAIGQSDCRMIGLSISGNHSMPALSRLVVALQMSQPATPILVAGQSIEELMPLIDLMNVDGIVETVEDARAFANRLT